MKKILFSLLASACTAGLWAQSGPMFMQEMELSLLFKTTAYNSIEVVDAASNTTTSHVDFWFNNNRKIIAGRDSTYGTGLELWQGNISADSNIISVLDSSMTPALIGENRVYWDSQFTDTLWVSYADTNSDGILDREYGLRTYRSAQGLDSAKFILYEPGGSSSALLYKVSRNAANLIDSLILSFDFMGIQFPILAYSYTWNGNAISSIEASSLMMNETIFRLQVQNNSNDEITAVTYEEYDSTAMQWTAMEHMYFKSETWFDTREQPMAQVDFFPNPARDWLNILTEGAAEVEIMGMDGRSLYKGRLHESNGRQDISHLPAGAYILHISTKDYSRSFKLLKE